MNSTTASSLVVRPDLLLPLRARAAEQRHPRPLLADPAAVEAMSHLPSPAPPVHPAHQVACCVRAWVVDSFARGFLERHPHATVVELGAGLSTRCCRLVAPGASWQALDAPEVTAVRQAIWPEGGQRRNVPWSGPGDHRWIEALRAGCAGPALVIAEGVLPAWSPEQVIALFGALSQHRPGVELVFDAIRAAALRVPWLAAVAGGQPARWSPRDPGSAVRGAAGGEVLDSVAVLSLHHARWPGSVRWAARLWPGLVRSWQVHRTRLGGERD